MCGNIYTHMNSDYKKYLIRQLNLKEAQFVPYVREDEHPDIDPEILMRKKSKKKSEHPQLSAAQAELIAKQHMRKGVDEQGPMMSPTAIPTPIIGVAIRGSVTGGLPSGADRNTQDLAPHKLGGYNRVEPEDLNTTLVDKTPGNPEIKQETTPINQNPSTGQGVTHPHQIQVTAGEEPQSTTGASTDSDPTLKLKSGVPKGIDIDITEKEEEPTHEEENPMIPTTSLSETFERHKQLALGIIRQHALKESKKTDECATCGCGDPSDTHKDEEEDEESVVECQKCHNKFDFNIIAEVSMGAVKCPGCNSILNQEGYPLFESKHKAGCECGFCKNKGSFKKKDKAEVAEGDDEDNQKDNPDFKEKDKKQFRKDRSASKDGDEVRKHLKGDVDEGKTRICYHCKQPHPCKCDKKDEEDSKEQRDNPESYRKKFGMKVDKRSDLNESYSPPFSRMRGLAGLGKVVLASNGNWTDNTVTEGNPPGASHPFNTNWKMDKEKAGYVKIDEEKLKQVKAQLDKKSKRGSLSDKELLLTKRLNEVLKRRASTQR